jgi:hypothetical protein
MTTEFFTVKVCKIGLLLQNRIAEAQQNGGKNVMIRLRFSRHFL